MKVNKLLIGLLTLIAIFLIINFFTKFWIIDTSLMDADLENFNNLLTPTISLLAFVTYSIALFFTIRQNKLLISQNIKPFYEELIQDYINKAQNIELDFGNYFESKTFNALNYISPLNSLILSILIDSSYTHDFRKFLLGEKMTKKYIESRNYYKKLETIEYILTGLNPLSFFYQDIKKLLKEIEISKMVNDDKLLLTKKIDRIFLNDYKTLIETINNSKTTKYAYVPDTIQDKEYVDFVSIADTFFGNYYDMFKNNK